jgi:hypothetical protein
MADAIKNTTKFLANLAAVTAKKRAQLGLEAVLNLEVDYKRRIFLNGQATNGRRIGKYSTDPMYVSIQGFKDQVGSQVRASALKPKGKDGSSKFRSGKLKKSRYLGGGYSELRRIVGRQNSYVDLNLTGSTDNSITTGRRAKGAALGYNNLERADLANKLEQKYGKDIFTVSKKEEEAVSKFLEDQISKEILKQFGKI